MTNIFKTALHVQCQKYMKIISKRFSANSLAKNDTSEKNFVDDMHLITTIRKYEK